MAVILTDSGIIRESIIKFDEDLTQSQVNPLGKHCVRVASKHYWRYQIINGELISYDHVIDSGTY